MSRRGHHQTLLATAETAVDTTEKGGARAPVDDRKVTWC